MPSPDVLRDSEPVAPFSRLDELCLALSAAHSGVAESPTEVAIITTDSLRAGHLLSPDTDATTVRQLENVVIARFTNQRGVLVQPDILEISLALADEYSQAGLLEAIAYTEGTSITEGVYQ